MKNLSLDKLLQKQSLAISNNYLKTFNAFFVYDDMTFQDTKRYELRYLFKLRLLFRYSYKY